MIPDFQITGEAGDLTANYRPRLLSIRVTDNSAEQADSVTIELADPDGKLTIPYQGHKLQVSLGYKGNLVPMGTFIVDQVELSGHPDRVTINGKSAPFTTADGFKPIQTRKTRSFDDITLADLAEKIAGDAGLSSAVDPAFSSVSFDHIDQTAESDANLLTRLCRECGAVFKCSDGKLIVAQRGKATSVTGLSMPDLVIYKSESSSYTATLGKRTKAKKVTTKYHDVEAGETKYVEDDDEEESDGADEYEHPMAFSDEESAKTAAASLKDQLARGAETVSATIVGRPDISAEGNVTFSGFNERMNGSWILKSVEHSLSKSGYTTTVQAENSASRSLATAKGKAAKGGSGGGAFVE